jgi:prepilin-type N-terminal cleavage/methylation domain-containing protein
MRSERIKATWGSGGFSLIEIIITLVVLSIAVVGILSVFTTGIQESADPLVLNQAIALAQEQMDVTIALKKSGGFGAVVSVATGPFVPEVRRALRDMLM